MKRSASPTIRTHPDFRVSVAAAMIATLFLLCAPSAEMAHAQESTQQMPAGMKVGEGGVSIGGGVFAGDGCAKVGELEAGNCDDGEAEGKSADGAADEGGDAGGASDEQYGAEDGSGGGATVLESTTLGDGGAGSGGGESTQSQVIESTTGVVEQGSDAEVDPSVADGETGPEGAAEQRSSEAEAADQDCAPDGPMGETTTTTVERAIDGDTVETPEGTVRLIGVDTPETVDPGEPAEPGGEEASEFAASELKGEEVELEPGTEPEDDYGRALAYLWIEDERGEPAMFNDTLLREGKGELLVIPPNDEYERCLAAAEKAAQDEGVGVWADAAGGAGPVPPDSLSEPEISASEEPDSSPEDATSDDAPTRDQYADEAGQPEDAGPETTESEGIAPAAAEAQYEEATSEPTPSTPTDEPEIPEEGPREPRVRSSELADAPAELPAETSAELPSDDASAPTTSVSPAPAGVAPITTLPETGGVSAISLAAGTLLVCSGLLAARQARTLRRPDNATAGERARS